jgi:microcystin-dependent protein
MATPFIAEIKMFGGNFAPRGFVFCQGQLQAIQQNTALFSLLGTTYGGNGTTNFGVPDMQGRVPMGFGNGPGLTSRSLGEKSGVESTTLTSANLPAHTHSVSIPASTTAGNAASPAGNKLAASSLRGENQYTSGTTDTNLAAVNTALAGSSSPVSIVQPFLAVNFIIAISGIFPSRN